ncbi:MAG: hypothetical protein ACYCTW_03500 [Sulfuricella sp.]
MISGATVRRSVLFSNVRAVVPAGVIMNASILNTGRRSGSRST